MRSISDGATLTQAFGNVKTLSTVGREMIHIGEQTGNLDGCTGNQIIELLFQLHDQHKTTLVLITHDLKLAARCERVVRIADGLIVGEGLPG